MYCYFNVEVLVSYESLVDGLVGVLVFLFHPYDLDDGILIGV